MDNETFYRIYLPALKEALAQDSINHGFFVYPPEYFIDKSVEGEIESFIENELAEDKLIQLVDEYFDAKSHYATEVRGVPIQIIKGRIINEMNVVGKYYE
ncbi:hypothetical protein CLV59_109233 [Chitinophaga dinghuensis]|uniref:Uncharacterized protein n=1 Tax=Chitinophaga dinghuensis TaxID=1539050 RepID=A0A327VQA0_9BACT|nr:hypothetical protein [Chitinophaga dinghuensis]RAJ75619.1 hypothetical protein CLV59_109233 [Chitinophaga dinghuensis]